MSDLSNIYLVINGLGLLTTEAIEIRDSCSCIFILWSQYWCTESASIEVKTKIWDLTYIFGHPNAN